MVKVYFATNRKPDPAQPGGFGADITPQNPSEVLYAVTDVQGILLDKEDTGTLGPIGNVTKGGYSDADTAEIIASGKNLLVFIHGFANSFQDAIKRAAFNAEWLRASGVPAADTNVLAFTWPSLGQLFAAPPYLPMRDYYADQTQAGRSGYHLGYFLNNIAQLRLDYRKTNPNGRIFLLAHSMGNHALQAAVEWWFANGGSQTQIFDEVFLAAGDEVDDTFESTVGAGLSDLPLLADRISIYYSINDIAMTLSAALNLNGRLGFLGPDDKSDAGRYPVNKFRIAECSLVKDYDWTSPPDATHQYYRRSKIVRAEIAGVMGGTGGGGLITL